MTTVGDWTYLETCYKVIEIGVTHATAHWSEYLVRSPPPGVYMVFGFIFAAIGQSDSSQRILFGFGYTIGTIFNIFTSCFLWTVEAMYVTVAWLTHHIRFVDMIRTWAIVYTGNTIGAIGGAFLCGPCTGIILPGTRYANAVIQSALNKVTTKPIYMFMRAFVGNWVICITNFMITMNKTYSGKVLAIVFGVTAFATIGYDQALSNWNMLTMAKIVQPSAFSWTLYFECCILSTLGNLLGGVVFMALPVSLAIYLDKFHSKKKNSTISSTEEVDIEDKEKKNPTEYGLMNPWRNKLSSLTSYSSYTSHYCSSSSSSISSKSDINTI
jgi:formate/nitrite transporter FocA (FNT family)